MIDNIFLESRLTGQNTSKIIIDDISDHLSIVTIVEDLLPSTTKKREITSNDIRPKSLNSLNQELKTAITNLNDKLDVNSQFNEFHNMLQSAIKTHCPITTRKVSKLKFR